MNNFERIINGLHDEINMRGFSYVPILLPHAPSPRELREWKVEINPNNMNLPNPLPRNRKLHVSLRRILLETGIALTPALSVFDPQSWFALYRYGADFLGTNPSLRFYNGIMKRDPILKAVAAEELATGVTCYVLREHFSMMHISDVYDNIQNGELEFVDPNSEERPDYYCEDIFGEFIIAESKGVIGTRGNLNKHLPKGWSQVQNVRPVNHRLRQTCNRVVIGTHFCVDGIHARSETTTVINDPEGLQGRGDNLESDMPMRLSYAKFFRFIGQDALADKLVFSRILQQEDEYPIMIVNNVPVWVLGFTPFGGLIGLYAKVFKSLFYERNGLTRSSVTEALHEFQGMRETFNGLGYTLPNGIVLIHDWDDLNLEDI